MNVAIHATGLGKLYGNRWALRDCSLRVPAGRITGLVGPNGAGKTTLLRMAVGLLEPTSGEISVFGWSPTEQPALVLARVGSSRRTGLSTGVSQWAKFSSWAAI